MVSLGPDSSGLPSVPKVEDISGGHTYLRDPSPRRPRDLPRCRRIRRRSDSRRLTGAPPYYAMSVVSLASARQTKMQYHSWEPKTWCHSNIERYSKHCSSPRIPRTETSQKRIRKRRVRAPYFQRLLAPTIFVDDVCRLLSGAAARLAEVVEYGILCPYLR